MNKSLTYDELIRIQFILDEWCHYDNRSDSFDRQVIRKVYYMAHGKDASGY